MNTQKNIILSAGLFLLHGQVASGAISVTYNFDSQTANNNGIDGDVFTGGGVAGWDQDRPNIPAGPFYPTFGPPPGNYAYIGSTNFGSGATPSGYLGSLRANAPTNSSTTLSGDVNLVGVQSLRMNLGIFDNQAGFNGRDAFSVSVTDSAATATVAEIAFNPAAGNSNHWTISLGVNGNAPTVVAPVVIAESGYIFQVNFGASETSFLYGAQGAPASVPLGTRAAVSTFDLGEIQMKHTTLAVSGTSANMLTFDNIVVTAIPEPSSALLLVLGGFPAFLSVRRRNR